MKIPHGLALLIALSAVTAATSRVLAQAALPTPLSAALGELDGGYLVDYDVVAELKAFGRTNRNRGQLMQPAAAPERVSVNNQTGYVAVRRGKTMEIRRDGAADFVRYFTTDDKGEPTPFFRNFFRPEQTPIEVRTLPGPFTVSAREGAVVTYASPSHNTRLRPGAAASAVTEVSVDTAAAQIVAIRVREYDGESLAFDVAWRYSNWRDAGATAGEFDIAGPIHEAPRALMSRPRPPEGPTIHDLVGERAAPITGTDLDGGQVRLSPKRMVLFFSATWCGPCKVALRQLDERRFELHDGLRLVYVNKDDTAGGLRAYFGENFGRLPHLTITDADDAFAAYRSRGIPMMVEVDGAGVIVGAGVGSDRAYLSSLMAGE